MKQYMHVITTAACVEAAASILIANFVRLMSLRILVYIIVVGGGADLPLLVESSFYIVTNIDLTGGWWEWNDECNSSQALHTHAICSSNITLLET